MTSSDDNPRDEPPNGKSDAEPELPLDEDSAWRLIVENYGERPDLGDGVTDAEPDAATETRPGPAVEPVGPVDEHFVPPEPPPVPRGTPARRLAWIGLFGSPILMLAAVVFGWVYPTWFAMALVAAFVGGFVFLVATMPRDGGDGWDDGAVV